MCGALQKYIDDRYFNCPEACPGKAFDSSTGKYEFNYAEQIGNELLTPLAWVFKELKQTDSPVVILALSIAGIFTGILGLGGIAIKSVGEFANPKAGDRKRACIMLEEAQANFRSKLSEITGHAVNDDIDAMLASSSIMCGALSIVSAGFKIDTLFRDRILKERGATDDDLNRIGANGLLGLLSSNSFEDSSEEKKAQDARLETIKPLFDQWKKAWEAIQQKMTAVQVITDEEITAINEFVKDDEETSKVVMECLSKIKVFVDNAVALNSVYKEYNDFVKAMA
jgi:hypothetical protein